MQSFSTYIKSNVEIFFGTPGTIAFEGNKDELCGFQQTDSLSCCDLVWDQDSQSAIRKES